jgi:PAS domain S-box-containing protein
MLSLISHIKQWNTFWWNLITRPSPAIIGQDEQRLARIGSAGLFILLIIGISVQLVYWFFSRLLNPLDLITVVVLGFIGLGYLLSRTRHYRLAITISIFLLIGGIFSIALLDYRPGNEQLLYYLVVPILFSTLFYRLQTTIALIVLLTTSLIGLPFVYPRIPIDLIPIFFFLTVTTLIILGTYYRNQLELDRQTALKASEARYRQLVNLSPDGIAIHRQGVVLFANPALLDMLGLTSQSQLMFHNLLDFVSPSLQKTAQQWLETPTQLADSPNLKPPLLELEFLHQKGYLIQTEALQAPLSSQSNATTLLMVRDVSERNRTAARLREAQKMESIGRLAGGVAHDFNNLLTIISSYASLIARNLNPHSQARQDVEHIRTASHKAAELVQQLLTFSRLQYNHPRNINLNTLLENIKPLLLGLLPNSSAINLHFDLSEKLDDCYIDPEQMERLLVNLISNARDAMPSGGQIYLSTQNIHLSLESPLCSPELPPGAYVALTVRDTGVGIAPEVLPKIMEPFFTTKAVGQGTGLGLATCFGIAKLNEGHIEVRSQVGVGSEFVIYLPRLSNSAKAPTAASSA